MTHDLDIFESGKNLGLNGLSKLSMGSVFVVQYHQSSQVQYGSQPRPLQAEVYVCSSYTEGKK